LTTVIASLGPLVLIAAGAPSQRPDVRAALDAIRTLDVTDLVFLSVVVVAIGFALQPFQFGLTQVLEGYWGVHPAAARAMTRSTRAHYLHRRSVIQTYEEAARDSKALNLKLRAVRERRARVERSASVTDRLLDKLNDHERRLIEERMPHLVAMQEASRWLARYPDSPNDLMPTRLGNVLRKHERVAGAPYGLDAVTTAAYLAQVADQTVRDYYDDSRNSLDIAVRMVLVWGLTSAVTFGFLWRYDGWLLVPATASALSYMSYRGAVAAAERYGESLKVLVALGRIALYNELRIDLPPTSEQEVIRNQELKFHLSGQRGRIRYVTDDKQARVDGRHGYL
jgi:hypothetical protein